MASVRCCRAKRAFGYGKTEEGGVRQLEEGEVFALHGLRNDERLLGMRFCEEVAAKARTWPCSVCSREFAEEHLLRRHQAKTHSS